jgi:hypothetical protein
VSIEIRRATLADRSAIERFIQSAYEELAPFKGPDRWTWQFLDNPFLESGAPGLPVWIALDGDKVVGQLALQAAEVKIGEAVRSGGWLVDVMVDADHRGLGLGHRLHDAMARDVPVLLTLTMAPATRRMAERSGAVTLGATLQFSRWDQPGPQDVRRYLFQKLEHRPALGRMVDRLCRWLMLDRIVSVGLSVWLLARPRIPARPGKALSVREVERFGAEIDELWASVQAGYPAICPRTSTLLNWRFVQCPLLRYRRYLAYRGAEPVGYSILRFTEPEELRQGVIVDVFTARDDRQAQECLVGHALGVFRGKVASVEAATSIPELQAVFRRFGFLVTRRCDPTLVASDQAIRQEAALLADQWFFSKADHDWDQIHLA